MLPMLPREPYDLNGFAGGPALYNSTMTDNAGGMDGRGKENK